MTSQPEPARNPPEWPSTIKCYVTQRERERIYALQVWLKCVLECDTCHEKLPLDAFTKYTRTCDECARQLRRLLFTRRAKAGYARSQLNGKVSRAIPATR